MYVIKTGMQDELTLKFDSVTEGDSVCQLLRRLLSNEKEAYDSISKAIPILKKCEEILQAIRIAQLKTQEKTD